MSKATYIAVGTILGALAGCIAGYFVATKKYEERLAEEVASYKKVCEKRYKKIDNEDKPEPEPPRAEDPIETDIKETYEAHAVVPGNPDTKIGIAAENQIVDYTTYFNQKAESIREAISKPIEDEDIDKNDPERPYVITPDDYYDDEELTKIELYLFDDGLLTDDNWDPIEEPEKVVPMAALRAFVLDKDMDELFTKSDSRQCLYTIEKQRETWDEYVSHHPIIVDTRY